jgi:hypothetical protein
VADPHSTPSRVEPAPGKGFLHNTQDPDSLPGWIDAVDLAANVAEFEHTGFRGGLNWYRAIRLSWELMAPWLAAAGEALGEAVPFVKAFLNLATFLTRETDANVLATPNSMTQSFMVAASTNTLSGTRPR